MNWQQSSTVLNGWKPNSLGRIEDPQALSRLHIAQMGTTVCCNAILTASRYHSPPWNPPRNGQLNLLAVPSGLSELAVRIVPKEVRPNAACEGRTCAAGRLNWEIMGKFPRNRRLSLVIHKRAILAERIISRSGYGCSLSAVYMRLLGMEDQAGLR